MAWAHIRAKRTLASAPAAVGGQPVFVTDDTPVEDTTRFCQRLSRASTSLRLRPTRWTLPTVLTYFAAALLECIVRWLVRPCRGDAWRLSVAPRALIAYAGSIILFSRLRAAIHMDYEPIFNEEKSIGPSAMWYERWYVQYVDDVRGRPGGEINSASGI